MTFARGKAAGNEFYPCRDDIIRVGKSDFSRFVKPVKNNRTVRLDFE